MVHTVSADLSMVSLRALVDLTREGNLRLATKSVEPIQIVNWVSLVSRNSVGIPVKDAEIIRNA